MLEPDLDRLVDRAVGVVGNLARRGSTLTTGVAMVAFIITGGAYLVGLGAFDGAARTVWVAVGAALVILAVGTPLLASYQLRSIPRHADSLVAELRTLLRRSEPARRIVVETVEHDAGPPPAAGATRPPTVIVQSGQFNTLRQIASESGNVKNLLHVTKTLAYLPALVSIGLATTGLAAFLGFIFTLIWLF